MVKEEDKGLDTLRPFACPVCLGRGFVAKGFYSTTIGSWVGNSTATEQCRTCIGTGMAWCQEARVK